MHRLAWRSTIGRSRAGRGERPEGRPVERGGRSAPQAGRGIAGRAARDWNGAEAKFTAAIPGLSGDDLYLAEFGRYMALLLGKRPDEARQASAKLDTYPDGPVRAMSRAWLSAMSGDLEQALAIIKESPAALSEER